MDHNGWTRSDFVAAAARNGIPTDLANKAYDDPDLFKRIPVQSSTIETTTKVPQFNGPSAVASTETVSASCVQSSTNVFGSYLIYLRLTKTWKFTYGLTTVTPVNLVYYQEANLGWSFNGIVGSQEYYGTYQGHANGKHTSYRSARFENDLGGTYYGNLNVSVTGLYTSGHQCTGTGGV